MTYGTILTDVIQSSTAGTPPQFNDGNSVQTGTLCRAWVNFDGTTSPGTIRAQFNVSSITKNATGDFTVNFTTAFADINYNPVITTRPTLASGVGTAVPSINRYYSAGNANQAPTTSTFRFNCTTQGVNNGADVDYVCVAVFR